MEEIIGDVVIMRGLPSIGKTTLARLMAGESKEAIVLSGDDYFLSNGEYKFDKEKLEEASKWNFTRFKDSIAKKLRLIIVDNTNIKAFHYYHYIDYAQRNSYRVSIMILPHNDVSDRELAERSPHNVQRSIIYKMRKGFQWDLDRKRNE